MNVVGILFVAAAASPEIEILSQARLAQRAGDTKRAVVLARTALDMAAAEDRTGDEVALHREAQDILLAAGRGDELVRLYDNLLRKDTQDPARRYLRARVEPDAARRRRDLETLLLRCPDLFWAAYDLAELHARAGDWERAAACAERAAGISPDGPAAWNVLGHLRLESSRFLEDPNARKALALRAREAIERAVELDPEMAEAHYNLGLVRYALGEKEGARASFLRAVELRAQTAGAGPHPELRAQTAGAGPHPELRAQTAGAGPHPELRAQTAGAGPHRQPRAQTAGAEFAEALNALGHMCAREGDFDEAVAFYERALAARPDYGSAHNNIAVAYYRKGEYARAHKHMARAEAAGHAVAPSFRRAVVREEEKRAFLEFQRELGAARPRTVEILAPGRDGLPDRNRPVAMSDIQRREVALAAFKLRFRDSRGGVRLGERRVGGEVVARYRQAGRVDLALGEGRTRVLVLVARESLASGRKELVPWVVEAGFRFSAEAPDLVRLVAGLAGLEFERGGEGASGRRPRGQNSRTPETFEKAGESRTSGEDE